MRRAFHRLAWLKSGVFWRTFFLLAFLIAISMAIWIVSLRIVEQTPRAHQIAAQVVSIVTITRAALTHSAPDLRRELLFDLASNEGIRIYPLEETDRMVSDPNVSSTALIESAIKAQLGIDTQFASSVNSVDGFWVSFKIDSDQYWLMLDRERVARSFGIQLIGWAAITMILSLLGAVVISRLINQPLAHLTAVARAIARGQHPEILPEKGPTEIREANRSFNQMVNDLNRIESDRILVLAGISHDLRTPLARMQLEIEMAQLPIDAREGMQSDIGQMDAIIEQFLDYARPLDINTLVSINLTDLLNQASEEAARHPDVRIISKINPGIVVAANHTELQRVVNNLIENARRYGKRPGADIAIIEIRCRAQGQWAIAEFADYGSGIPETEIARLLRPFTRLNTARTEANGSGLGLAIVERIVRRHRGSLRISNRKQGGLKIVILLPLASS